MITDHMFHYFSTSHIHASLVNKFVNDYMVYCSIAELISN